MVDASAYGLSIFTVGRNLATASISNREAVLAFIGLTTG
jgi:hypothetical protein